MEVPASHRSRFDLLAWALFCLTAGAVTLLYIASGLAAGQGSPLLPLDDVYIHFQYARQMASFQPYVYNPGLPPSSGATSLLYPWLLAAGHVLGFQGLNLGLWAMALGVLALLASMWTLYRLVLLFPISPWAGQVAGLLFGLNGAVSWHYFSGMETGLLVCFMLLTLYAFMAQRPLFFVAAAGLLALMRPEGSIMAAAACVLYVLRSHELPPRRFMPLLPLPLLALQPLLNLLLTGSASASGGQAKSLFGLVPQDWGLILQRIAGNWLHMWAELFTGYDAEHTIWYLLPLSGLAGAAALLALLVRPARRWTSSLVLIWLLSVSAAVSTLDTAFWHFRRYQLPLMALLLLFALVGAGLLSARLQQRRTAVAVSASLLALGFTLLTLLGFVSFYKTNIGYVVQQPLQMARWLSANTPEAAVVAVHDVGLMRYLGGRTTFDMVGLTTPGAADYWRHGPGAVAELLLRTRPDYIASYGRGHGYGLGMLADTSLFGAPLVTFTSTPDPRINVALAGAEQGIYRPDWEALTAPDYPIQPSTLFYLEFAAGLNQRGPLLLVNVADLQSEAAAGYTWSLRGALTGFPTEVHELDYMDCALPAGCRMVDGGRRIDSHEAFNLPPVDDDMGLLLVTRLHPAESGQFAVYVDEQHVATRWIPQMPGRWLEVVTYIPPHLLPQGDSTARLRIVPDVPDGYYHPYTHSIYPMPPLAAAVPDPSPQAFYQNGDFWLETLAVQNTGERLLLDLIWGTNGRASGDYRFFVHLYDDLDQPPPAQVDMYPAGNTLPPGNWLPGPLHDTIMLDLSALEPGSYTLAIGFYKARTEERLMPVSDVFTVMPDGRLLLEQVEISSDGRP